MARLTGIEPAALNSGGLRSIQLSYRHAIQLICSKKLFLSNMKKSTIVGTEKINAAALKIYVLGLVIFYETW